MERREPHIPDERVAHLGPEQPTLPAAILNALFMHLPCGVIVIDAAGVEVFINTAGSRMSEQIRLSHGTVARSARSAGMSGSPPITHGMRIARALAGDLMPDMDYILGEPGETRYRVIQVAITPLRDGPVEITGAFLTLTDLTERLDVQAASTRVAEASAQDAREALAREADTLARTAVTHAQDNRALTRSNMQLEQQALLGKVADALAEATRRTLAQDADTLAQMAVTQAQDNRALTRSNLELEQQATLARLADALAEATRKTLAREADTLAQKAVAQAQDNRELSRSNTDLEQQATLTRAEIAALLRALTASEDRFQAFMDNCPTLATMKDDEGHYVYVNSTYERLFQQTLAELVGKTDADLWPPQTAELLRDYDLEVLQTESSHERLISLPTAMGDIRQWLNFRFTLRDIDGRRLLGSMAIDVTARLQAEQALAESEERFRQTFDDAPIGMALFDREYCFVEVNRALCEMLGYSEKELVGRPYLEVMHPDDRPLGGLQLNRNAAGAMIQPRKMTTRYTTKSGDDIWGELTVTDLHNPDGAALFGIGMIQNITDRRLDEQRRQRHFEQLSALRAIDLAITTSLDMRLSLGIVLDQTMEQLGVDAAQVLLLNPQTQLLEAIVSRGFKGNTTQRTQLRLGEGYAGRAAIERRRIDVADLSREDLVRASLVVEEGFVGYFALPLQAKGQLQGVLEVFHRAPPAPDSAWLDFLETLADQAAIAIDNVTLFDDLQRSNSELTLAYDTTIVGWSRALDLRDRETEGHSRRVTEKALALAQVLGIDDVVLPHVRRGALLHDIGKMGIPDQILLKPGPLSDEEWVVMRRHPVYAYELLSPISYLHAALDIPYCHHERWDGAGYPRGLKGEQIPLAARLFAVVDVWDALLSDRSYRPGWPPDKVREHLRSLSGTHFDPTVVTVFLKLLDDETFV